MVWALLVGCGWTEADQYFDARSRAGALSVEVLSAPEVLDACSDAQIFLRLTPARALDVTVALVVDGIDQQEVMVRSDAQGQAAFVVPPLPAGPHSVDVLVRFEDEVVSVALGMLEDSTPTGWIDLDADGFGAAEGIDCQGRFAESPGDCNDDDAATYPGAPETIADGVDQDCDGLDRCFVDQDGDGHGTEVQHPGHCDAVGSSALSDDCDDADAAIHPDADEVCDGLDTDCDGQLGALEVDVDSDGYLVCAPYIDRGAPHVLGGGDCHDDRAGLIPTVSIEVCDGIADSNCDGIVRDDEQDVDGDGFLPCAAFVPRNVPGIDGGDDCDDTNPLVFTGAVELCDDLDTDCDGLLAPEELDGDGDGAGHCRDCDDDDTNTFPGAVEICDGKVNDCDGALPADEVDSDGDLALDCADCDDHDRSVYPGAPERCDGVRNDCTHLPPDDVGEFKFLHVAPDDVGSAFADFDDALASWGPAGGELHVCGDVTDVVNEIPVTLTAPGVLRGHPDPSTQANPVIEATLAVTGDDITFMDLTLRASQLLFNGGAISRENAEGSIRIQNVWFDCDGTFGTVRGGAVYSQGTVEIVDSTFSGCASAIGGAVYVTGPTVIGGNTVFENNRANNGFAGALWSNAPMTIEGSVVFRYNVGEGRGGAAFLAGPTTLDGAIFEYNQVLPDALPGSHVGHGGGLYLAGDVSHLTDVEFIGNQANNSGGGVYLEGASGTASGLRVSDNQAETAGGIRVTGSGWNITDAVVRRNIANETGGGVFVRAVGTTLSGDFSDNQADFGAGVFIDDIQNSLSGTINDNNALVEGGGLLVARRALGDGDASLHTVTFSGNQAPVARDILLRDQATLVMNDVVFGQGIGTSASSMAFAGTVIAFDTDPFVTNLDTHVISLLDPGTLDCIRCGFSSPGEILLSTGTVFAVDPTTTDFEL